LWQEMNTARTRKYHPRGHRVILRHVRARPLEDVRVSLATVACVTPLEASSSLPAVYMQTCTGYVDVYAFLLGKVDRIETSVNSPMSSIKHIFGQR
jgi:hypothetical protein